MRLNRRAFVAGAGGAFLAGCSNPVGGGEESEPEGGTPPGTDPDGSAGTAAGSGAAAITTVPPSASRSPTPEGSRETPPVADATLPLPMEGGRLRSEAVSTGVGRDGIPAIDQPRFVDAGEASEVLADGDPVFGLVRNGVAKAYPQRILVHHEIVNDEVGGDPVSVTYCPLTGTVLGFERGENSFGVSGRLINNNLVMYDRRTETWWPQVLATSIPGPWNESPGRASLREFRLVWTAWKRWRSLHPDTRVLSEDTNYIRNYDQDPYGSYNPKRGYYAGALPMYPAFGSDDRFDHKTVVMGARTAGGAAAFRKDALRENGTIAGEIAGDPVVAVYDPRLDTAYVYRNPEGAAVSLDSDRAVLDGAAHDPDSLPLNRIHTFDSMWFAWAGFYPDTSAYG